MEFHLRISTTKKNGLAVLNEFQSSFKISAIVSAFEHKGIETDGTIINPHCHSYIKYYETPTKQAISAFFKKWKHLIIKPKSETAGYSHIKQKKSKEENIIYTIKDGDIIINTLGDLNIYKEKTKMINDSKSLSSRDKLFQEWMTEKGHVCYPTSKFELFKFIDEIYVLKWNKSPLAMGHKICYSTFILMKTHELAVNKNIEIYEMILHSLYNIHQLKTREEEHTEEEAYKLRLSKIKPINIKQQFKIKKPDYETDEELYDFESDDDNNVIFE